MAETIRHGSHDHQLQHIGTMDTSVRAVNCRACDLPFKSENVDLFGCRSCGFFLHRSCCFMPTSLKNPAHPQHQLQLRYTPAYNDGIFSCYICGNSGKGFNYGCQACRFDAHVPCVNLPSKARSPAHQHRLQLLFRPPAMGGTSCGFCGLQIHYCCYSCSPCSFLLHPKCLKEQPRTGRSNNQQGPQQGSNNQQGPTKQDGQNLGMAIMRVSALCNVIQTGHQILGWFGDGAGEDHETGHQILGWLGNGDGEDHDVQDGDDDCDDVDDDDDFGDDMSSFGQGFGGYVDIAFQKEARSLAFEHMARMGEGA
ncbi:uncharacterized protein LOC116261212 [Nymphaea colorata]|nr:uncharacterized protein LOC116261212 [Nymphaea colorata]